MLVELVIGKKEVLENKNSDTDSCKTKAKAWEELTIEFNIRCPSNVYRDAKTLKRKYNNIKSSLRREFAESRKNLNVNGNVERHAFEWKPKKRTLWELAAALCLNTAESVDASISERVLPFTETTANGCLIEIIKEEILVGNYDFEASQEQKLEDASLVGNAHHEIVPEQIVKADSSVSDDIGKNRRAKGFLNGIDKCEEVDECSDIEWGAYYSTKLSHKRITTTKRKYKSKKKQQQKEFELKIIMLLAEIAKAIAEIQNLIKK